MPLSKGTSNKAREKNIEQEIAEGRPLKQAEAIGYSEQRAERAKRAERLDRWANGKRSKP